MPVNYTMITQPVSVNSNQIWGEQDIDGNFDGILEGEFDNFLTMYIVPTDTTTHTVNANNFDIANQYPDQIGNLQNCELCNYRAWNSDESVLPDGVDSVTISDTIAAGQVGNEIKVTAILNSNYQISESDIIIELDIQGDADEIDIDNNEYVDPNTNEVVVPAIQGYNDITLVIKSFYGDEISPNVKIHKYIPCGISSFNNNGPLTQYNNEGGLVGAEFTTGGVNYSLDYAAMNPTAAWVMDKFRVTNLTSTNQPLNMDSTLAVQPVWFIIKPEEGYTLSKFNFTPVWAGWSIDDSNEIITTVCQDIPGGCVDGGCWDTTSVGVDGYQASSLPSGNYSSLVFNQYSVDVEVDMINQDNGEYSVENVTEGIAQTSSWISFTDTLLTENNGGSLPDTEGFVGDEGGSWQSNYEAIDWLGNSVAFRFNIPFVMDNINSWLITNTTITFYCDAMPITEDSSELFLVDIEG